MEKIYTKKIRILFLIQDYHLKHEQIVGRIKYEHVSSNICSM